MIIKTTLLIEFLRNDNLITPEFSKRDSAFDDDISLKDETFRLLNALIDRNSGGEKQAYTVEFI